MPQVCASDKHQQTLYFVNPVIQLLTPVFFIFSGTWKYYEPKKRYLAWLWTGLTTLNLSWLWRYFELQSSKETKFVCKKFNLSFQLFAIFFKILIIFADLVLDKSDKNEDWSQIEVRTRKLCCPMIYDLLVLLSGKMLPKY